jgi:hypothetical protein
VSASERQEWLALGLGLVFGGMVLVETGDWRMASLLCVAVYWIARSV